MADRGGILTSLSVTRQVNHRGRWVIIVGDRYSSVDGVSYPSYAAATAELSKLAIIDLIQAHLHDHQVYVDRGAAKRMMHKYLWGGVLPARETFVIGQVMEELHEKS